MSGAFFDDGTGSISDPEDAEVIGDASGLSQVVGDDDEGDLPAQGEDLFFDDGRCDGIEGAAGFVEKDDFRLEGEGPGDAEALLLSSGELEGAEVEAVRNLWPETHGLQAVLYYFGQPGAWHAVGSEWDFKVLAYGVRKGVRFLKDHADAAAQGEHVGVGVMDVGAIGGVAASADLAARNQVGEPVQGVQ